SFGKGIMPLTFEALKGQRFRWCFGGIQILRRHWRSMLPGRETEQNRLNLGQRWAYLTGGIQWYGDLLAVLFFAFLLVGAANIAFSGGLVFRKLTGFLLAAIPLLVVLGLLRAVALLRRGTGASWREAIGAFFIWQSTGLTIARASVQALFAKEATFLRTPKTQEQPVWTDALKANWAECSFGLLGLAAIAAALSRSSSHGGVLLAALLVWPTASFLAAPYNSLTAQHASLPPELRERRRTEHRRYGARRLTFAAGGLAITGAVATLALGLFARSPSNVTPPQLIGPARGLPVRYGPGPRPAPPQAPRSTSGSSSRGKRSTSRSSGGSTSATTTPTHTSTTTSTPMSTTTSTDTTTTTTSTVPTTTTPTTTTGSTTSTAPSSTSTTSSTTP
ncbi:MAG TPA: hypothetical protein VG223_00010, partial [Solirubrobacteraceae bacterium]|nr:hypothetical protein [Solirubrobacteraceae bacterium]